MPTPERTSLEAIVTAGCDLLEVGGPAAVTMRAVAQRVSVRAPSLYKRVRDRDALLDLVTESAADELARRLEASDGTIAGLARTYRAFAHDRPESFRLLFATDGAAEAKARSAAPILEATRQAVGDDEALAAARLLTAWATGFLSMELSGAFRLGGDVDAAFEYGLAHIERGLRGSGR